MINFTLQLCRIVCFLDHLSDLRNSAVDFAQKCDQDCGERTRFEQGSRRIRQATFHYKSLPFPELYFSLLQLPQIKTHLPTSLRYFIILKSRLFLLHFSGSNLDLRILVDTLKKMNFLSNYKGQSAVWRTYQDADLYCWLNSGVKRDLVGKF